MAVTRLGVPEAGAENAFNSHLSVCCAFLINRWNPYLKNYLIRHLRTHARDWRNAINAYFSEFLNVSTRIARKDPIRISSIGFNRVGNVKVELALGWCMDAGCGSPIKEAWMKNLRPAEEGQ